jgi:hypothetical protein
MILGMSTAAFTTIHVLLSLIGIASGSVVVWGLWDSKRLERWTMLFLSSTVLTSLTGFFFHSKAIGPPHIVGAISLIILALTIYALRAKQLAGVWRRIYVVGAIAALYFNSFVGVVQAFLKIPPLRALAPQGSEPPFVIAQALLLVIFVAFGVFALKRFHPAARSAA